MRHTLNRCGLAIAMATMLMTASANADALITNFDNFTSDALFNAWSAPGATIVSGPSSYDITATGYGSNYKYIEDPGRMGAGNTMVELSVTLSGPPAADGQLGPLVQLIDGDGTHYNYRWYGQPLGSLVLTRGVESPDFVSNPGTVPGLDLNALIHMHMELDPGGLGTAAAYTVSWENLALTVPEPCSMLLLLGSVGLLGLRRSK